MPATFSNTVATEHWINCYDRCSRVVGPYQPVAVEKDIIPRLEHYLLLLVGHAWHESQGHSPGPQFLCVATMPEVGEVVACVGVGEPTTVWVEDSVEAGDKHVGGYAGKQRLV